MSASIGISGVDVRRGVRARPAGMVAMAPVDKGVPVTYVPFAGEQHSFR